MRSPHCNKTKLIGKEPRVITSFIIIYNYKNLTNDKTCNIAIKLNPVLFIRQFQVYDHRYRTVPTHSKTRIVKLLLLVLFDGNNKF